MREFVCVILINMFVDLVGASSYSYSANVNAVPKRYVAHTATFSRLATIRHVYNYLCNRLKIRPEDVRLWKFHDEVGISPRFKCEEDSRDLMDGLILE